MLRREQHRQHVVDRRQLEASGVVVVQREVAEVPIGVGDQGTESRNEPDVLERCVADSLVPMQARCSRDPVIQLAVEIRIDRE